MPIKKHAPEEIITLLGLVEIENGQGKTTAQACGDLGFYRAVLLPLTRAIIDLATEYGRYGYRRVTALLRRQGWDVNHKRVERIWRSEGLQVPQKQPKRTRLWLNHGSCIRLRATHARHVWSYDFVMDRTQDGRAYRMLTVIDEYTHECLAIKVKWRLNYMDVLDCLNRLFLAHGVPEHIRSDNGAEFTAKAVREW